MYSALLKPQQVSTVILPTTSSEPSMSIEGSDQTEQKDSDLIVADNNETDGINTYADETKKTNEEIRANSAEEAQIIDTGIMEEEKRVNVPPMPPKVSAWAKLNKVAPAPEGQQNVVLRSNGGNNCDDGQGQRKKFKTIAKGLSMMNRVRTEAALSREQHAFFVKYGMSTSEGAQMAAESSSDNAGGVRAAFNWEGMSKWEFVRTKLVLDPGKDYYYHWLGIVFVAYCYNLLFIVFRCAFIDSSSAGHIWLFFLILLDIFFDLLYLLDVFVRSRTGYLEQGLLVKDVTKVTRIYWKGTVRWLDLASCLPLDYVFEIALRTSNPCFRFNRLFRLDRVLKFVNDTEMHISKPNIFRVCCVLGYILVLIHWNGCFYYFASYMIGIGSDEWVYGEANVQSLPEGTADTLGRRYLYSFYWSTLMLTTLGEVPWPVKSIEFVIVCVDLLFGVLFVAAIVGNVGSMIANTGAARSEFQTSIDNVKNFLKMRRVGQMLVVRISRWFDYLWQNKQAISQDQVVLKVLPEKLQAEIAMHVHFETLRKVRIFQVETPIVANKNTKYFWDCEAGLLGELVLKLELHVFSPLDYVCRKGDVGREMYIVKKGRLQVVADNGIKVLVGCFDPTFSSKRPQAGIETTFVNCIPRKHTMHEGAVFGELSLLNIPGSKQGNRRSASIRSVGYSDLFVLKKADLMAALREYPEAKKLMIQRGREMLQKDGLLAENAPLDDRNVEQKEQQVREHIESLQQRLARLTAEYVSSESRLQSRVDLLEKELLRCGLPLHEGESGTESDEIEFK